VSVAKAKWTAGAPSVSVSPDGTLLASVPLRDNGTLAATVSFTITPDRALEVRVLNEPGAAGLSDFRAWEV
jgi:hypothetical protein